MSRRDRPPGRPAHRTTVAAALAVALAGAAPPATTSGIPDEADRVAAAAPDEGGRIAAAARADAAAVARQAAGDVAGAEAECRRGLTLLDGLAGRAATLERVRLLERLGATLYRLGRAGDSAVAHGQQLAAATTLGDPRAEAGARLGVGRALFVLGRYDAALDSILAALRTAERTGDARLSADAGHLAGLLQRQIGHPSEALALLRRSADAARRVGDDALLALALNEEGNALREVGRTDEAQALKREAMALARGAGNMAVLADCANDLAVIAYDRGNRREYLELLEQSYAVNRKTARHRERVIGAVNLAVALGAGDPARARALLSDALDTARAAKLPAEEELVRAAIAGDLAERGRHADAFRELSRAYELRRSTMTATSAQRLGDIQALYDAERRDARIAVLERDREIERLRAERAVSRQNAWAGAFAAAAALATALGVGYRARTRSALALAAAKGRVEELARTDPLTGLANRRRAAERLQDEALRTRRGHGCFSVVTVDLDRFKEVNDAHGHECGDAVLRACGAALARTLRDLDLAARWGGEEFLLVLPGTDRAGAVAVAEKLRVRLRATATRWRNETLSVTGTFGVAECADGDVEACLRAADAALYEGKRAGRDVVVPARAAAPPPAAEVAPA